MPVYQYVARDCQGKQVKGEISVESKQHAVSSLKVMKLYPVSLEEKDGKSVKGSGAISFRKKITKKSIAVFTRQFAAMLQAGIPLSTIMDVLIRQERNPAFREVLKIINGDIQKGSTLSGSMSRFKIFTRFMISMVEVGEVNGRLDISFERLAATLEKEERLSAKVKGAMIYPAILLVVSILSSVIMATFVLPSFTKVFEQFGIMLPFAARIFIGLSRFMVSYWYVAAGTVISFAGILYLLLREPMMKEKLDRFVLALPFLGRVQTTVLMARFCRTFSSLLEGGVDVVTSLETVKNVIGNQYFRGAFDEIIRSIQGGAAISGSISGLHIFSPLVVSMIRIGEESGKLGEVLSKTAEFYEEESEAQLQRAAAMVEPMITIIMAIGIGFIVISVIQPMFQIYTLFSK